LVRARRIEPQSVDVRDASAWTGWDPRPVW
jgi:hypothetical protein